MVAVKNHTVTYFIAPRDHFWHWTDNGTVITWANGNTICYRDDLFGLLQQVNSGLPPLSPLLLLLTACARPLQPEEISSLYREVKEFSGNDENNSLHRTLQDAVKFLEIIAELPANLRTGQKRVHLIYEVFAGTSFIFDNSRLRDVILELNSGRLDKNVFHYLKEKITEGDLINNFMYFCTALKKYPTVQSLIVKLRTGLDEVPEAAPVLLPDAVPGNLYDLLLQDPETMGIARLAKRITAALNIPMQSKGSSDMPFGGISDITNRGNYDKLLLSELAHDDDLLMARLVNNEALYFRREQPPQNPKMHRVILIDTTLKMWGTSRVFALAAGLACAQQNKHVELIQAHTLGGNEHTAVSLNSKQGIIQALEKLDPALHCGMALEAITGSTPVSAKNEFIFITHARLLHHPGFYASFAKVKQLISFIITVTDTGELQLHECINGISKLISNAKIDVDELLAVPQKPKAKRNVADTPAFLTQIPAPLYYPHVRIKIVREKMFVPPNLDIGAIAVNESQRVFLSVGKDKGLVELLSFIEKGAYTFGMDSNNEINILVSDPQRQLLKLYKINTETNQASITDLPIEIGHVSNSVFMENRLYIESNNGAFLYDCIDCVIIDKKNHGLFQNIIAEKIASNIEIFKKYEFFRFFDQFSNVFYRVKNMHISSEGKLVLGKHELHVWDSVHIRFKTIDGKGEKIKKAKPADESLFFLQNKKLAFNVWLWDDGSEAIVDPRGLLHLKSPDKSLPEITVILVLDRVVTCWASDNSACGSPYFMNEKTVVVKSAELFYNDYIQKFINRLM